MTDGVNSWFRFSNLYPDVLGDGDMTAYGRLKNNLLGASSQSAATAVLNSTTTQLCSSIKAQGIQLYVLLYNHNSIDTTTQNLMQACATSSDTFYISPSADTMQQAFGDIGKRITSISLVQ